jgi:biopolymer transport protein ExbB
MIGEILQYWRTGGGLMAALAILSYGIWFHVFHLRRSAIDIVRAPDSFEDELLVNLSRESFDHNLGTYGNAADALSRAVAHVLRAMRNTGLQPGPAFDQFQDAQVSQQNREALILAAYTAAAPLIGLLGTVIGMVATFRAVSAEFGNTAVQVSAGISQALITTQCGLVVAIPGLFGMAHGRRLADRARVRLGECRTHLVYLLEASAAAEEAG